MADFSNRPAGQVPRINHWVYESVAGQINGRDGEGRVLVSISTDPQFALRLAAAFGAAPSAPRSAATDCPPPVRRRP